MLYDVLLCSMMPESKHFFYRKSSLSLFFSVTQEEEEQQEEESRILGVRMETLYNNLSISFNYLFPRRFVIIIQSFIP